jgi:hypothetical protein
MECVRWSESTNEIRAEYGVKSGVKAGVEAGKSPQMAIEQP